MTQPFSLLKDPRITTSDADFAEQFDLLIRIRDELSAIVTGVNTIRSLQRQFADWTARLADNDDATEVVVAINALSSRMREVEAELVQDEFTADGDSLNYREQLFEKLSGLPPVVASADTRPTTQSYAVLDKLAGQVHEQLAKLAALVASELAELNEQVRQLGVPIISA